MNDSAFTNAVAGSTVVKRPEAFQTIVYGGLTAGILDGLFAVASSLALGGSPIRAFQYVAAGLIGGRAFDGGATTFGLGIMLHFFIAATVAAVYYGASLRFPVLLKHALIGGLLYGATVYFVMYDVVMPLSAVPRLPVFTLPLFLKDVIGHALLVGLPIALIARRSAKNA